MQPELRSGALGQRAADDDACAAAIRVGSRSFHLASRLLPADVRHAALAIYAFCRVADDVIDEAASPEQAASALAGLRARLERAYAGDPYPAAADRAFARVVRRYAIPYEVPAALLEGFEWDAAGRRYADFPSLVDYAMRVAGTVGIMMALVMGARSPAALARASELGIAMQLSNIARDVGEDARRGRIYLPLDWIAAAGLDADALVRDPQPSAALAAIVARVIDEAEQVYARAARGLGYLPPQCRPAIQIALRLYREIGRQVRRNGLDAVTRRAVVSPARKLAALGVSVGDLAFAGRRLGAPAPFAAGFLVDAVLRSPSPRAPQGGARWRPAVPVAEARGMDVPWWNISARVALMLELFMRLEQRGLN